MSDFKEVKFDPEDEVFYFVAVDSSGGKERQFGSRVIVLGVGAKNQPDEESALAAAELLLPSNQIETMDQLDLRVRAIMNLIRFRELDNRHKIDYKSVKKLGKTFSVFRETEYWQKFNRFFQLMIDNWDQSGWDKTIEDYRKKLDQARRDEDERKTQKREDEIINTGIGKVILPGELEERYKGKQGEILLKYMFLEQEISERDYHNRGKFGPHSVANHPLDFLVFPDDELSRKQSEEFYDLLAKFSGRSSFTREDFAREIVAIYPWLEENLTKEDLDSDSGDKYQLGRFIRKIKKEFKI